MHHQRLAVVEIGDEVFGAPPERGDAPAGQPVGETFGKRKPQIRAPSFDPLDQPPLHHGRKPPADGLDFGQFGH